MSDPTLWGREAWEGSEQSAPLAFGRDRGIITPNVPIWEQKKLN